MRTPFFGCLKLLPPGRRVKTGFEAIPLFSIPHASSIQRENLTTEQAEIVHNWANMKIRCFLLLKKSFHAEKTPFTILYFKAANETYNAYV